MVKILAIEDSPEYQSYLAKILTEKGFSVRLLQSAENIITVTEEFSPDLILMDIGLPGMSGFNACSQLKCNPTTASIPLFFLTCKSEVSDKVLGFKIGAEDYIVKPFEALELVARIESKIRKQNEQNLVVSGRFLLNLDDFTVSIKEKENTEKIALSSLEFKLLLYFVKNKNRILARDQIINNVWGNNVYLTDRAVDVHISLLRKKSPIIRDALKSIYGAGYKFMI